MSRIGKQIITVPSEVQITLEGDSITVKGPKGELKHTIPASIEVASEEGTLKVTPKKGNDDPQVSAKWGLTRALLNNMVTGVSKGFEKRMEIIGVGYRAQAAGKKITLNLGFSHPIEYNAPDGVTIEMDKENKNIIIVSGHDKQAVGEVAANIRGYRPPEPYKGKGIRYVDEYVFRKAGKKATKE